MAKDLCDTKGHSLIDKGGGDYIDHMELKHTQTSFQFSSVAIHTNGIFFFH